MVNNRKLLHPIAQRSQLLQATSVADQDLIAQTSFLPVLELKSEKSSPKPSPKIYGYVIINEQTEAICKVYHPSEQAFAEEFINWNDKIRTRNAKHPHYRLHALTVIK